MTAFTQLDRSLGTLHGARIPFLSSRGEAVNGQHCTASAIPAWHQIRSQKSSAYRKVSPRAKKQLSRGFRGCGIGQDSYIRCRHAVTAGVFHQIHGFVSEVEQAFFGARVDGVRSDA